MTEPKIDSSIIQIVIVATLALLMVIALIIDGEMGERVLASLLAGFGLVLGYFFRKATE